jgi:hypothetical protein
MKLYNRDKVKSKLAVGDFVWLKTHTLSDASKKITASLLPKYEGPYEIVKQIGESTFGLRRKGAKVGTTIANVRDLKRFICL